MLFADNSWVCRRDQSITRGRTGFVVMKVVVLPGLDGTGALLTPFCDALPAGLVGQGISYPVQFTSYDDIFDWLTDRLPTEEFLIVAESFSGPLGIRFASDPPNGLRGVVFIATFARCPRWLPRSALWLIKVWPFGMAPLAWASYPLTMGRWATVALVRKFASVMREIPTMTMSGRLAAVRQVDGRGLAPTVPTLYVRAKHDWLVPAGAAKDFCDIVTIDGPHFLLQTRPQQLSLIHI